MKDPIYFYFIHIIILFLLLSYFIYTVYDSINSLNNISTKINIEKTNQTWIPSVTICSDGIDYNINCRSYGYPCNTSTYTISKYINENMTELLQNYDGYTNTDRCFVFNNTDPVNFIPTRGINPSKVEEFIVLEFNSNSPGYWAFLSIYHPLKKDKIGLNSLQPFYNTSVRKSILFSYKKYILYNGDIDYEIDYVTNSYKSSLQNLTFGFIPKSYVTENIEQYKPITITMVIGNLIALLGTLFSIFTILSGRGPYSPTGLTHWLLGYNRAEYKLSKIKEKDKKFEKILNIYLNDIDKSLKTLNNEENELLIKYLNKI